MGLRREAEGFGRGRDTGQGQYQLESEGFGCLEQTSKQPYFSFPASYCTASSIS